MQIDLDVGPFPVASPLEDAGLVAPSHSGAVRAPWAPVPAPAPTAAPSPTLAGAGRALGKGASLDTGLPSSRSGDAAGHEGGSLLPSVPSSLFAPDPETPRPPADGSLSRPGASGIIGTVRWWEKPRHAVPPTDAGADEGGAQDTSLFTHTRSTGWVSAGVSPRASNGLLHPLAALLAGCALMLLPAIPFYTRLRRSKLLRHPLRQALLERLAETPGLNAYQLAKIMGRSLTGVQYQIGVLVKAGLVAERQQEGVKRFFVTGDRRIPETLEALESDAPKARLLRVIHARPGLTIRDAAEAARLAYTTARYHLEDLDRAGAIHRLRDGGAVKLLALSPSSAPPTE